MNPDMHPDERVARVQLAACYRVFAMLGWTEMIYNHITLRLPDSVTGGNKEFLINPFGLHYSEVTASVSTTSLILLPFMCNTIQPKDFHLASRSPRDMTSFVAPSIC